MVDALDIQGLTALRRAFRELPKTTARKVVRRALRSGAKIVQDEIRRRTPLRTGALARAIRVRAGRRQRGILSILVVMGEGNYRGKTFYGSFLEFGAPGHMLWGRGVRALEARHFIRDAVTAKREEVLRRVIAEIAAGIETEARALAGRAA